MRFWNGKAECLVPTCRHFVRIQRAFSHPSQINNTYKLDLSAGPNPRSREAENHVILADYFNFESIHSLVLKFLHDTFLKIWNQIDVSLASTQRQIANLSYACLWADALKSSMMQKWETPVVSVKSVTDRLEETGGLQSAPDNTRANYTDIYKTTKLQH